MKRLLTYNNGRLKTGRVAAMVFLLVIISLGGLFKLSRPVDQVLVAVRHVFEAEAKPAVEKPAEPPKPQDPNNDPAKADERSAKGAAAPLSGPHTVDDENDHSDAHTLLAAEPKPAPQASNRPAEVAETRATIEESKKNEAEKSVESHLEKSPPSMKLKDTSPSKTVEKPVTAPDAAPASTRSQSPIDQAQEKPKTTDIASGMNPLLRQKNEKHASEETPQDVFLAVADKDLPALTEPRDGKPALPKHPAGPIDSGAESEPRNASITVSPEQYLNLFKSWRTAGNGRKENGKLALRVENLRNAFSLFQMKPVAVVGNRRFYDLSDGTRIPAAALAEFSATVFRVQQPWQKWPEALSAAGIRPTDAIEVRYYMYDFIKNAIYERATQAFAWCREEGLINADTAPASVDILGRAFVIEKRSGGRFAVFVPVTLDTGSGQTIPIDPACFRNQPDVQALVAAGLL